MGHILEILTVEITPKAEIQMSRISLIFLKTASRELYHVRLSRTSSCSKL